MSRLSTASVVVTLLAAVPTTSAARSRSSFDFGWRYILGDQGFKPAPEPAIPSSIAVDGSLNAFCEFNKNLTGTQVSKRLFRSWHASILYVRAPIASGHLSRPIPTYTDSQCYGLTSFANANTADECQAACCTDYSCLVWQWEQGSSSSGAGCWLGNDCSQNTTNSAWLSGMRSAPQPPNPPMPNTPCTNASQPCSQSYNDSAWRVVNTPHDFVVEGNFSESADRGHGYLPFNKSWYRKTFTLDATLQGQLVWLDFDGVYKNSDMWLNNVYLGHFTSGYVSFRYFLHNATAPNSTTPVLNYGAATNVLSVLVDALTEQEGWFYEGGGITRHVWLNTADPLSITPWGAYYPASITGDITSGPSGAMGAQTAASARIYAQVDIANARAASADTELQLTVIDASGATVATSSTKQTISSGGWARVRSTINWNNVNLWNTESTYMYTVRADVVVGTTTVDSVTTSIGVRDAVWTANTGFMLNGFKVPAKGFSQHQDFAGTGTAVPDRINQFRIAGIRAIGGNFWRTAHNPSAS